MRARLGGISEGELHAYVDDMLAPRDRKRVEEYLLCHPEEFARVEAYRAQTKAVCILFGLSPAVLPPTLKELAGQLVELMNRTSELHMILFVAVAILISLVGVGMGLSLQQ